MTKALICGVLGQDGSYLARHLLGRGYEVWGTSRDAQVANPKNLAILEIADQVNLISMAQSDFRSVLNTLSKSEPDEIYLLSGQSSVGLSFEQPAETMESITLGTLNVLEALRFFNKGARLYHASSGESFGDMREDEKATEATPFRPKSPYGVAKASAHWLVTNYRESYGLYCCNGILFNHESPLRPARFVTKKIVSTACRIAAGSMERLRLGMTGISRDWGWAEEYVVPMWQMLQASEPDDYVIASGKSHTLEDFVASVFSQLGLDWKDHVDVDEQFFRPSEILNSAADPSKALEKLGWSANTQFETLIARLVDAEQKSSKNGTG